MRRLVCVITIILAVVQHAAAQHVATAEDVTIERQGDSVYVQFWLKPGSEAIASSSKLTITPQLIDESHTARFAPIGIYGRTQYLTVTRSGQCVAPDEAMTICYKEMDHQRRYLATMPYEPWMDGAEFRITTVETGLCDDELGRQDLTIPYPAAALAKPAELPAASGATSGAIRIPAAPIDTTAHVRIEFPVNKTDVRPSWSDNKRQLELLERTLREIASQKAYLKVINLRGIASPEGRIQHNAWLALHRAESLKRYLTEHYDVPADSIITSWTAEDWDGMRQYIEESGFDNKARMLQVIDGPQSQDVRLALLKRRFPREYRIMLRDCLPYLRYVDATFEYTIHPDSIVVLPEQPDVPAVSKPYNDMVRTIPVPVSRFEPMVEYPAWPIYRPWIALKTNALFDLALAFNFEIEVPLGQHNRWSVMAEYWFPWYTYHHNSRSYEVLVLGAEARYWLGSCRESRPLLSGAFVGLYAAGGKSDVEWNSQGDQMEFGSAGLTVGYSWPLSRHWNFEASVSAGMLFARRHHYHGQYNNQHLIWQYDTNETYFGPTKAKLSVVWLISNPFKKKGGHR